MSTRTKDRPDLITHHWRKRVRPLIYQRDNGICAICGKPIDLNIRSPHPMSYSVHHARGAATGYDLRYLRATHRGCNLKQGDPTRPMRS